MTTLRLKVLYTSIQVQQHLHLIARVKLTTKKGSNDKTTRKKTLGTKSKKSIAGGVKKPHRYRPGTRALMEIRRMQKTTNLLIRKIYFQRLVRQIMYGLHEKYKAYHWRRTALETLQEAAEEYLVHLLEDVNLITINNKHITINVPDMTCARRIRGELKG